jgi:hypothetical protein
MLLPLMRRLSTAAPPTRAANGVSKLARSELPRKLKKKSNPLWKVVGLGTVGSIGGGMYLGYDSGTHVS